MNALVSRHIEPLCREVLADTPILVIQGARQVGKSTLAQQLAGEDATIVTLDDADQREFARADPAAFLLQATNHEPFVIDELQRVPELTLQLKADVDSDRRPGRYIVTGSANLLKTTGSGDSLAGRQEQVHLRPLSVGEKLELPPEDFVSWLLSNEQYPASTPASSPFTQRDDSLTLPAHTQVMEHVLSGGFPIPLQRKTARSKTSWFTNYIAALSTHDAAGLQPGGFSSHLEDLIKYFATAGATELVKRRVSQHLGVSETTVANYLDLLTRMYLLEELPAWGLAEGSRVIRRPKVSLLDSGLAAALTGFTAERALTAGGREHYGSLLEQFAATELLKQQEWSDTRYRVFHFRERDSEVDIVIELADGRLVLLEVKSRTTALKSQAKHIYALRERLGDRITAAAVLYTGDKAFKLEPWLHVLPVHALWTHPRS